MRLSDDVHKFTSACEHLLADMAILRPLTPDEVLLVKHYCNEVLAKIDSPPTNLDGPRNSGQNHSARVDRLLSVQLLRLAPNSTNILLF